MSCWIRLGIEPTSDETRIRDAYRARLPSHHPETDPEGFQALRMAYENALRLAREGEEEAPEEETEESGQEVVEVPQAFVDFCELLDDPARRFNVGAWQAFVRALDELSLEQLDELSWGLYHRLADAGPLSYRCANLLARRMAWDQQLLDLEFEDAQRVEAFLQRIETPDPFDTDLMSAWSEAAQTETLWYARSLDFIFAKRPLHEFADFAGQHTCLPLPDDAAFIKRLLVQFTQAGIGASTFLQCCVEKQLEAPDDVDWLYLLACQSSLLGRDDQALPCWIRLWNEFRHPMAESRLLELCAKRQPTFLPLLIQAFDCLGDFSEWPADLGDDAQVYGSPSQRPETLNRWLGVGRLKLDSLAQSFVDWRMTGDELPLLAQLLGENADSRLLQLYRHAWALHRGDAVLLQRILDQPLPVDALECLVLSGFKVQAGQHLRWLENAPIAQAMSVFSEADSISQQLPQALTTGELHKVCRLWLRRLRPYSDTALERIAEAFKLGAVKDDCDLSELDLLLQLSRRGIGLPPVGLGEAAWEWHAQTVFLLALLDQPERWLPMIDGQCLERLPFSPAHPLSRLQPLLRRLQREQGNCDGLLGWLQGNDPVHGLLVQQLFSVQQALDSARLPANTLLYTCIESDRAACGDDLLGLLMFWGVLYHDPSLSAEQHRALLQSIAAVSCEDDWFEGFRDGLIKGEPVWPPRKVLTDFGVDKLLAYEALDSLKAMVRYGAAGVPKTRVLRQLQQGKDDVKNSIGLRLALCALLSWSERLMLAKSDIQPVPAGAIWRLGSRLGRKAFIAQVLGGVVITPVAGLISGTTFFGILILLLGVLLLFGATLRRLHDMGRGLPTLLIFMALLPVLPFLPLLLFGFPGDKLPNRYGVPPDSGGGEMLSGGLQAALRLLNG
ncbi:J domain-containing protein [Pseudomonas sp. R45(2017)]|uniref:J domain-containing protein n=1 Tax=Pseudomonas sp. R45(2017) TaxID=1981678 RepID=UPI000A1F13CC|nr:J domain-containing protein [Pseudomonas sp. R45(2017)]